jgi:hypothetical protein
MATTKGTWLVAQTTTTARCKRRMQVSPRDTSWTMPQSTLRATAVQTVLRSTTTPNAVAGFQLAQEIAVTTGQNRSILCAYRALPFAPPFSTLLVELAVFDGLRIGLRACRAVAAGERLAPVVTERLSIGSWNKMKMDAGGVAVDAAASAQRPVVARAQRRALRARR